MSTKIFVDSASLTIFNWLCFDPRHLNQWIPEGRLLALMRLGTSPYAKAYDAVVELLLESRLIRFGLEYEHTLKSARRYAKIREALEAERNLECILSPHAN